MSEEEAIEILKKCFEDIRGSMFWRDEWQALDVVEEYIKNSINKDKIREKIKELEERKKDLLELEDSCARSIGIEDCDEKIIIYNDLLEE